MIIQVIFSFLPVGMIVEAHCTVMEVVITNWEKGTNTGRKPVESKAFFNRIWKKNFPPSILCEDIISVSMTIHDFLLLFN